MKPFVAPALLAGLLLGPTMIYAQQQASPTTPAMMPPPGPGDGMHGRMGGGREQFEADRMAMRSSVIGALSPDHKRLLASIAGEIATAPQPDYRAAVARLDAALSPQETSAIIAAQTAMRDKMRASFQHDDGNANGGPPSGGPSQHAPDAGRILLGTALGMAPMGGRPMGRSMGGRPMDGGPGGPGGPNDPPPNR